MENLLKNCTLFNDLDKKEIETFIRYCSGVEHFHKDERIFSQGDNYDILCILIKGSVYTDMINEEGKIVKVHDMTATEVLAPMILYSEIPVLPVNINCTNDVDILPIERKNFTFLLQHNTKLLINFIRVISNSGSFTIKKIQNFAFKNIKKDISNFLLREYRTNKSKSFVLSKTQQQLADGLSVTRPALANVIGELNKENIIYSQGKTYTIINLEKLIEISK